jgi:GNAT superfamily N-acetyltransferase
MAGLEIHALSDLREEAAALLAERYTRQVEAEPLLPPIDDFELHLPPEGHVATRDGKAVAYLAGAIEGDLARWQFAGHAAREPEALRDLFAHQAAKLGVSRFMLTVPATDPGLVDVWFRLAFGCQAVWAVREVEPVERVEFAGTVRAALEEDLDAIVEFDELLYAHQAESPSFSELTVPPREALREEAREIWVEPDQHVPFVAELDGRVIGFLLLYRRPAGDLRVPANSIDLAFAATREDVRGAGAGRALTAHAFDWAHAEGFEAMTVDWRSVNVQSSRFWPRRGFRPQYLRLYRAVP